MEVEEFLNEISSKKKTREEGEEGRGSFWSKNRQ